MYEVKNLTKKFKLGKEVLTVFEDISFSVEPGDWVALTGSSGCGKTTLLHLLGGLDRPTSGSIAYRGEDFSSLSPRKRSILRRHNIGFIFQNFNLFPELNAIENILLPTIISGLSKQKAQCRAEELLELVGLADRAQHRPAQLSGGEQQRIAIARALIMEPDTLLADEPTGNLDDDNSYEIMNLFKDLHKQAGKTIIMVTHQKELTCFADCAIYLKDGTIIQSI
jgi:putative ABC transport system ATP-binding protein